MAEPSLEAKLGAIPDEAERDWIGHQWSKPRKYYDVAVKQGLQHLVLTTGGKSETYAMRMLADLAPEAFIQMKEGLFEADGSILAASRQFLQGWMDRYVAWIKQYAAV